MNELQILIENIRAAMSFPEAVTPDQFRLYAQRYAEACAELNKRMLQCVQHIRTGNTAEGVRMAEVKPNLQEMYLTLDMPDREGWDEIVSTLGYDQAMPRPTEYSLELNDAYLKSSALEPLLRWHRLYALNGSPLRERLNVLRSIAKNDPENMFWKEDQEKFEKVRIKELDKEISQAIAEKNAATIRSLHTELSSPDWILPPPHDYRHKLAHTALQDYADSLMQHFSAFDYDQAKNTYGTMQQILAAEQMPLPGAIQQSIRAAVQWLGDAQRQKKVQAEFTNSLANLREALEENTSLPTLEHLYYALTNAAMQAETTIPAGLDDLYQAEVVRLQTSATRRNQLIIISVIAACVLCGGILIWGILQQHHAGRVQETLATLQKIEAEQRFEDMIGTIERIEKDSPEIAKNAKVTAVIQRLHSMLATDELRAKDFSRYHAQADAQLSVPDKPGFAELGKIKIAIDQAEKLARAPGEKTLYSELKRKFDAASTMRQREIDKEYTTALAEISDESNALKRNTSLTVTESIAQAKEIALRIARIQNLPDVSPSLKEQGKATAGVIAEHQKKMESAQEQEYVLNRRLPRLPTGRNIKRPASNFLLIFAPMRQRRMLAMLRRNYRS